MSEFLAENNLCGQNLLRIVSVGNAIIAEILRLKDYIPDVFRLDTKADQQKYGEIIFDFSYLQVSDALDKKIEDNPELQDLDEEFRENYIEILTRFYRAFESTHQYANDLNHFIEELNEGYYIQQTLESVLQDEEGKQLMCESLYLFGVMLIILDLHIPGIIRERLLITYYRYSASKAHGDSNIDDVCKLLRSTGFSNTPTGKRLANYPENYFSRFHFDRTFVDMVIGRLRSDDIYNQMSIYPHPNHRSTALSNQAGMLYVCLYFSPNILHNQLSQMREITDKFFYDNWVVSIYMGITVNLIDAWDSYKAAKSALSAIIETSVVKELYAKYTDTLDKILPKTNDILKEGTLNEGFLIKYITRVINLIRDCNVTLRWFFMHTSHAVVEFGGCKKVKQVLDQIITDSRWRASEIFGLLLNTSQLELSVKDILKELMTEKVNRWNTYKREAVDRVEELGETFSGTRPLSKIEKNEHLKVWFTEIAKEISNLDHENPNVSGRKIIQLIQALEEVEEFHNLESNMHIKQYLLEIRKFLHSMVQTINIKEDVLINIQLIGDLSYAWHLIDIGYTKIMQESIKRQPTLVIKLRATFLKLASALEIPLLRINQAHSEDLISVSQYYSNELANYVRKVVQIIPETMFDLLAKIIYLQTEVIKEIPTRLEKDKLKEYAQLDERYKVASLTYSISVFTEGILMMKKTLVGVIELDPKQLLEDGIRKELVNKLSRDLHEGMIFATKGKSDLEAKLNAVAKTIDGYRRSFEYVQDYLNIKGLKIWQEEISRIINYNVERECNSYQRNKIQDWQSSYQSTTIPIPNYPPIQGDTVSNNFIGRLARELQSSTDPKTTIYLDLKGAWYERKTHKEITTARIFSKIREAIGPAGLVGLDKLYSFMILAELQGIVKQIQKQILDDKSWLETMSSLTKELADTTNIPNANKFYNNIISKFSKVWPKYLEWILAIGHKQILRQHIAYELNSSCKFNANNLESSLRTFNEALLADIREHELDNTKPNPPNELLFKLNTYLEWAGIYDPLEQIFIATKNSHYISLFLFLFTISQTPKFQFDRKVNNLLTKKSSEQMDSIPLVTGILTILQQFHKDITDLYLEYLGQFVTSILEGSLEVKNELHPEVHTVLHFLEIFIRTGKISRSILSEKIPDPVLNQYEFLAGMSKIC